MAAELGLSQSAVSRIWRAFGLQPHRQDTWKLSKDPLFVDKVKDVVGLYLDPPERAVVLCVDEKSQIQALDRTAPILPMLPGTPQRATHDYKRHGTSSLYAALDIATGKVIGSLHARHRAIEFKKFLTTHRPRGARPTSTCTWCWTTPRPTRPRPINAGCSPTRASSCTSPRPRAPGSTSSSAGSRELTTKKLQRGTHRSVRALNADIRAWIDDLERQPPALRLDQDRRPDPRHPSPATAHELTTQDTRVRPPASDSGAEMTTPPHDLNNPSAGEGLPSPEAPTPPLTSRPDYGPSYGTPAHNPDEAFLSSSYGASYPMSVYGGEQQGPPPKKTLAIWALVLGWVPCLLGWIACVVLVITVFTRSRPGRTTGRSWP